MPQHKIHVIDAPCTHHVNSNSKSFHIPSEDGLAAHFLAKFLGSQEAFEASHIFEKFGQSLLAAEIAYH